MRIGSSNLVKDLKFKSDARDRLISGIDKLTDAVGSTLGASGRHVIIEGDYGEPHVTKDGVTVARSIVLEDSWENLGVSILKKAAQQTASRAGDGTTTSTVLAQAIIKSYLECEHKDKHSFRDIKNGIENFAKYITQQIDKKSVKLDKKRLYEISTISANNDTTLGRLIGDAFISAGEDGVVTIEQSSSSDTKIDTVEGTKLMNTCTVPHFFTNPEKEICELENPLVFLSVSEIPNFLKIREICEYAIKSNRSLLIISPLENQVTSSLARNKLSGAIKVNVVDPPSFGHKRKDLLEDLALLLGARVFDESLGDSIDAITPEMLGSADKAISDIDGTVLVINEKPEAATKRIEDIRKNLEETDHPILIKHLEQRLGLLNGGVSIVRVGGDTEVEMKEKLDRVDDAVSAVRAAKREGILPGGGAPLLFWSGNNKISGNAGEITGGRILAHALKAPFRLILSNAGLRPDDYEILKWGIGVDVIDGELKNMLKAGIIDPALVTKQALNNAVSVALTILSTDCVISNIRES